MRVMWYGKREAAYQIKSNTHMSKLRQNILIFIRKIGNNSGCHQLPERSFFYKGKQFPVCARCTGVFLGQCIAFVFAWLTQIPLLISGLLLAIIGLDWLLQNRKIYMSTNWRRLFTGAAGGFGIVSVYAFILRKILQ